MEPCHEGKVGEAGALPRQLASPYISNVIDFRFHLYSTRNSIRVLATIMVNLESDTASRKQQYDEIDKSKLGSTRRQQRQYIGYFCFLAATRIFLLAAFKSASLGGNAAMNFEYQPSSSYPAARARSHASLGACNHRAL